MRGISRTQNGRSLFGDPATGRLNVVVPALVVTVALMAWERWFHDAILGLQSQNEGFIQAGLRDWVGVFGFAVLSIAVVNRVATRLDRAGRLADVLRRAGLLSACLGLLLAVGIVVAELFLNPSVTPAPGAGYLETGFAAAAIHGLRDGLIAQLVLLPVSVALLWFVTRDMASSALESAGLAGEATRQLYSRREALQLGSAGTFAVALGTGGLVTLTSDAAHAAPVAEVTPWLSRGISLYINGGVKTMIDRTPVYMLGWGYESEGTSDPDGVNTPGPVIWTSEGQTVELTITNNLDQPHNFAIDGIVDTGPIASGRTVTVSFPAPTAGTYIYGNDLNGPVNRVLGLNGVLLVMPADGSMRLHSALDPQYWEFHTQWVWVMNEIDPRFNAMAQAGRSIDVGQFEREFKPRYFTMNGRSGSLAAHVETAPDTVIVDKLDNSALIRMVNAGLAVHCPHMHGNHVYVLAHNGAAMDNIMWKDQIMMKPADRKDVYLPYNIPPNAVYWPPHPDGAAFLKELHGKDMEGTFPMHCHVEQSQTAGGGLYPQGLLTDWKFK